MFASGLTLRNPLPFSFETTTWNTNNFTDDRLVHASAQLNRACFVDRKDSTIYVFPLGLRTEAGQSTEGFRRGTLWQQRLAFPRGTKVVLEDVPAGVAYDAAKGVLSWKIPAAYPVGNVTLLLNVTLPGKEETYQKIEVPVR